MSNSKPPAHPPSVVTNPTAYPAMRQSRLRPQPYPFSNHTPDDSPPGSTAIHLQNFTDASISPDIPSVYKKHVYRPLSPTPNHPIIGRIAPTSIFITVIALALFAFSIFFANNIDTIALSSNRSRRTTNPTLSPPKQQNTFTHLHQNQGLPPAELAHNSTYQHQLDPPVSASSVHPDSESSDFSTTIIDSDHDIPGTQPQLPRHPPSSSYSSSSKSSSIKPSSFQTRTNTNEKSSSSNSRRFNNIDNAKVDLNSGDSGRVGWTRSWPLSKPLDSTGLYEIQRHLKLTNKTLLNYFHLHKTGGVSMKAGLLQLVNRPENAKLFTRRGTPIKVVETCYQAVSPISHLSVNIQTWRCDFRKIREMSIAALSKIDVILGHQYWENGSEKYFEKLQRSIKYFSVLRHPLARKLSFYYHFYVRNVGLNESTIPRSDVIKFVLNSNDLVKDARARDAGPNYYASRLASDGISNFKNNQFRVNTGEEERRYIEKISKLIDEKFIFMGLQTQNFASTCMLEKTMQVFAHVHGIDHYVGTQNVNEGNKNLKNTGNYNWTAEKLWESMSAEERESFKEIEKVDLAIYKKVLERFQKDVRLFKCEHLISSDGFREEHFD